MSTFREQINEFRKSIGLTEEITDIAYLDIVKVVVDPVMRVRNYRGRYYYNSYIPDSEEKVDDKD